MAKGSNKGAAPTALLVVLVALVGPMLGWAAGFVKKDNAPQALRGYLAIIEQRPLPSVLLLLALVVGLAVLQHRAAQRTEARGEANESVTPPLRANLLTALKFRIQRRLADSLEHEVRLKLDLVGTPEAVLVPRLSAVRSGVEQEISNFSAAQDVFDQAGGRLLVLGAPGAGKTTLLLELAAALIDRAIANAQAPIPVVVNLASWSEAELPIRDWLVDELKTVASINGPFARAIVESNGVLVLFDGLDEVRAESRTRCVSAINDYLGERAEPAIVCCRREEYEGARSKLQLHYCVRIEPLDSGRVRLALKGPQLEAVRKALKTDPVLSEIVTSPLMLSVVLLTYTQEKSVPSLPSLSTSERQAALWDDYLIRMLRRGRGSWGQDQPLPYAPRDMLSWLTWLARHMCAENMVNFLLDHLQPSWLARPKHFLPLLIPLYSLAGCLVGILITQHIPGLIYYFAPGGTIVAGLLALLDARSITPVEKLSWSWRTTVSSGKYLLLPASLFTAIIPVFIGLPLTAVLVPSILLTFVIIGGSQPVAVDSANEPGERLRSSVRNALIFGVVLGLATSIAAVLGFYMLHPSVRALLIFPPIFILGLVLGFFHRGGKQVLNHYALRLLLVREGAMPVRYADFLRAASDLLLLQQDRDLIRFRHILLRDHIAQLTPEQMEELAARVLART